MDERQLWDAINSLHEQAHGPNPLRTCAFEPCRTVTREGEHGDISPVVPHGPAPLTLMNAGGVR